MERTQSSRRIEQDHAVQVTARFAQLIAARDRETSAKETTAEALAALHELGVRVEFLDETATEAAYVD